VQVFRGQVLSPLAPLPRQEQQQEQVVVVVVVWERHVLKKEEEKELAVLTLAHLAKDK